MAPVKPAAAVLAVGLVLGNVYGQEPAKPVAPAVVPAESTPTTKSGDEPIRAVIAAFTKAFNAGDAGAVAKLYTTDAELIDSDGALVSGRADIEKAYADLFRENPGLTIEIRPAAIRAFGLQAYAEDGVYRLIRKGGPTTTHGYAAIYTNSDGKWLQMSVREYSVEPVSPHERLNELSWLLGDWIDQAHDATTISSVRWSTDKNYLLRDFSVSAPGRPVISGTQRIGWDASTGQIKSWVFDSEGGHGEGLWARAGNQWVIKMSGVLQDGRVATATHYLTREGTDSCRWRTVDRTVGADVIPIDDEFFMVRRPPQPATK